MAWACSQAWQLTPWHYRREMFGKVTRGRKRMELLHDMMEGRDCGQLNDLISDRSSWRQDSKWECMSETCWKQQKLKTKKVSKWVNIILSQLCNFRVCHMWLPSFFCSKFIKIKRYIHITFITQRSYQNKRGHDFLDTADIAQTVARWRLFNSSIITGPWQRNLWLWHSSLFRGLESAVR